MKHLKVPAAAAAISAMFLFVGSVAHAEMLKFTAELNGASSVPPTDSAGTGTVEVDLDTTAKTVTWTVTSKDLSGEPTASHIHGPASPTEAAGPQIDTLATSAGSAPVTDEQIADLTAGKYYYNIHSAKYPDGEIRGQLMAAK